MMLRIFRHYLHIPSVLLGIIEMTTLYITIYTAAHVLQNIGYIQASDHNALATSIITFITAAALSAVGLYNRFYFDHMKEVVSRSIVAFPLILLLLAMILWGYGSLVEGLDSRTYALFGAVGLATFFPLLLLVREIFSWVTTRVDTFRRRVVVNGSGARGAKIDQLSRQMDDRRFTIAGFVRLEKAGVNEGTDQQFERRAAKRCRDYWIDPSQLVEFCSEHRIDEIVVAASERRGMPVRDLLACKLQGIEVTEYATFWERESGQVDLDEISPSWLLFSDGFLQGMFHSAAKRVFDIVLSVVLLTLTLPITIPTAVLIKLESKGPLFYLQERVGLRGRRFMVIKFRSMRTDAEKDGPQWAAKNDNRITRIGAFIRRVRIDEIPQVINVLKGEMSFVGPRPERPVFVEELGQVIPYYHERHAVKPGITGWAQINYPYGATVEDARNKLAYDLYYVKNSSLLLDNIIVLQTLKVLLWNSGAR